MARGDGGVDRAVNARVKVVGAADHSQHFASVGVHHHHGSVAHVVGWLALTGIGQLLQPIMDTALRRVLRVQVQRGVDLQSLGVYRLQAKFSLQSAAHVHHKMGCFDGEGNGGKTKFFAGRQVGLLLRDVAVLDHQAQYHALPGLGGLGILQRIVAGWRLRQPGQQRTLRQVQLSGVFGKVGASGRLDAVGQVAVVGLVQVECQNLVFAVGPRQSPGQDGLAQFALQADLGPLLR